jgi:AAA15 family ATPase/GTPase
MIREIKIENYKSIQQLKLNLGRITVFIGENGCGKSNILEAIALASAAANDKLDNEFLVSRGIRVTEPQFMRSAFEHRNITQEIKISLEANSKTNLNFVLQNDNQPYSHWFTKARVNYIYFNELIGKNMREYIQKSLEEYIEKNPRKDMIQIATLVEKLISRPEEVIKSEELYKYVLREITQNARNNKEVLLENKSSSEELYLNDFLIYSPDNNSLRTFEKEGQIQPLGIKGEGLLKLLKVLSLDKNQDKIHEIKENLKLIDWFQDFEIPHGLAEIEKTVQIKDKYLDSEIPYTDVSEEVHYNIPKYRDGQELSSEQLIEKVIEKFKGLIGEEFYCQYQEKIIFAISVHSTECWLLPLYSTGNKQAAQTKGCFDRLRRQIKKSINKSYDDYDALSREYCKNKVLMNKYTLNPSLKVFIEKIQQRNIVLEDEEF